jgi:hypothetical protein
MKTNVSRSFVRFIRRNNAAHINRGHAWSVYRVGGRKAILAMLNPAKVAPIKAQEVTEALTLPASMPKGSAAKIAGYDDSRTGGGMIHIVLKAGFTFDKGLTIASVSTVKDAIAVMRTAKSIQ